MRAHFALQKTYLRRLGLAGAVGITAIAAAGCSSFVTAPTATQPTANGPVEVTSEICLDGFGANDQPAYGTNSATPTTYATSCQTPAAIPSDSGGEGRLLIAYLVPTGSGAPATLTSPNLSGATFTPSSAYDTWLTANETTPTGFEWFGYESSELAITDSTLVNITAPFTPPAGIEGEPYYGPFKVQSVVEGDREDGTFETSSSPTYATLDPNRALDCADAAAASDNSVHDTGCVNDSAGPLSVATTELTATPPNLTPTARAGTTATISFYVDVAGSSTQALALNASTDNSAITASPESPTFTPVTSGTTVVNVTAALPSTLTPGDYTVTLNVGGAASATSTLDVTAPITPQATPRVKPQFGSLKLTASSLKLSFRLNVASVAKLTLERRHGHGWVKVKAVSTHGILGSNTLKLKTLFSAKALKSGHYRLLIKAANGSLASSQKTLSFTIS